MAEKNHASEHLLDLSEIRYDDTLTRKKVEEEIEVGGKWKLRHYVSRAGQRQNR